MQGKRLEETGVCVKLFDGPKAKRTCEGESMDHRARACCQMNKLQLFVAQRVVRLRRRLGAFRRRLETAAFGETKKIVSKGSVWRVGDKNLRKRRPVQRRHNTRRG